MSTLIVYESMYGHTHAIAEAIAEGIRSTDEVRVVPVGDATGELMSWADLVIVGGPTHAHGMSSAGSRKNAVETAAKPDGWSEMIVDPAATGPGIREWLEGLEVGHGQRAAAFDTRVKAPALLTGRASGAIAKGLRGHGFTLVVDPESFLVDTHTRLVDGELARAASWGASLVADLVPTGSR